MKNNIFIFILGLLVMVSCTNNGTEAETGDAEEVEVNKSESTIAYTTIAEGSNLEWRASHLAGTQPRNGKVLLDSIEVLVSEGKVTNVSVLVDMSTLAAENFEDAAQNKKLTDHLKSADFFEVEKYPTSKFEVTSVESIEGDYNSKVTGNLTILDATKSITFSANINVSDSEVSIKSEDFSVDRTLWGLEYNVEGTEGVPVDYLIANEVGFTINVTVKK